MNRLGREIKVLDNDINLSNEYLTSERNRLPHSEWHQRLFAMWDKYERLLTLKATSDLVRYGIGKESCKMP